MDGKNGIVLPSFIFAVTKTASGSDRPSYTVSVPWSIRAPATKIGGLSLKRDRSEHGGIDVASLIWVLSNLDGFNSATRSSRIAAIWNLFKFLAHRTSLSTASNWVMVRCGQRTLSSTWEAQLWLRCLIASFLHFKNESIQYKSLLKILRVLLLMEEILHHLGWLKPYK